MRIFQYVKIRKSILQSKCGFLIAFAALKEPGMRKAINSVDINAPKIAWRMSKVEYSVSFHQQQSRLISASNQASCFVGSVCISYRHTEA